VSRLTLPNGDWVDFVDRLNYAQARRSLGAKGTPDQAATLIASLVTGWALRDVNDQPIPLPAVDADGVPLSALDLVPFDVFQQMGIAASKVAISEKDPKDTSGPSLGSPRGSRSRSRTISPTRTSSPIIPDGPGMNSSEHRQASSS
jgi:hypothetical protein